MGTEQIGKHTTPDMTQGEKVEKQRTKKGKKKKKVKGEFRKEKEEIVRK